MLEPTGPTKTSIHSVFLLFVVVLFFFTVAVGSIAKAEFAGFIFILGLLQGIPMYLTFLIGRNDSGLKVWVVIQVAIIFGWWILIGIFNFVSAETASQFHIIPALFIPWVIMLIYTSLVPKK